MDIPIAVATAGVSMSMADVDFLKTGQKEGSQYTMMGLITVVLVGVNCKCQRTVGVNEAESSVCVCLCVCVLPSVF